MQITHQWKIAGKDLDSCNNVSYFNGHYYFAVEGTVAGVRLIKTKVISIKVECKFLSYNCFSMNNKGLVTNYGEGGGGYKTGVGST